MSSRKYRIVLFLCLAVSLSACHNDVVPDDVVDTATLAQFLSEAHLIDSYYNVADNRDSAKTLVDAAYDSLYVKYGISKEQYDSTIAYYLRRPQMLEEVYSRVLDNLNAYTERKLNDCRIADSIAEAQNPDSTAREASNKRRRAKDEPAEIKVFRSIKDIKGVK